METHCKYNAKILKRVLLAMADKATIFDYIKRLKLGWVAV